MRSRSPTRRSGLVTTSDFGTRASIGLATSLKTFTDRRLLINMNDDITERELVITRDFDVPARFLFQAYSKREHLLRWFGPAGWPLTLCEVDFRVGGRYRFAMTGPSGVQDTPFGGEYLEIVPNQRLVFDNAFEKAGAEKMVMTVLFDEHGDGTTTLTLCTLFASKAMLDMVVGGGFREGVGSGYDQLAALVAETSDSTASRMP